jgi:salicylate 1-O-methyltransferase
VKLEVLTEGSFVINQLEIFEANKNASDNCDGLDIDFEMSRLQHIRAGIEPLLTSHFGENVIEEIFNRYKKILSDRISKERTSTTNLTITLTRKP